LKYFTQTTAEFSSLLQNDLRSKKHINSNTPSSQPKTHESDAFTEVQRSTQTTAEVPALLQNDFPSKKRYNSNTSSSPPKKQKIDSTIPPYFKQYIANLPGIIDCGYFDILTKRILSCKVNPGVTHIDNYCKHGITLSTIQNAELISTVMHKVQLFLETSKDTSLIILCHSQNYFDYKLLMYYMHKYNLTIQCKEVICVSTVNMMKHLFRDKLPKTKKGNPSAAIENVYKYLIDQNYKQTHHAIFDAISVVVILEKLFGSFQNAVHGIINYAKEHKHDFVFKYDNFTDECLF
jgi:hypothetical protein